MNYYVFRIDYGKNNKLIRDCLFKKKELRQGWGGEGFDLKQSQDEFIQSWKRIEKTGEETDDVYKLRKYKNLLILKDEIKPGDYIIIPKTGKKENEWNYFTIVRCKELYKFDPVRIREDYTDFGHLIKVEILKSTCYLQNGASRTISAKFKGYQCAVNRVYNEDFISAVDQLLSMKNDSEEQEMPLEALSRQSQEARDHYLAELVKIINTWSPGQLEKIITQLFEKQGYIKRKSNNYNGVGGDIDILFDAIPVDTLLSDLCNNASNVESLNLPEIRVQAKNKTGWDDDAIRGVQQLKKMEGYENAINVVINTGDGFGKDVKEEAGNAVILIDGKKFAMLLLKYGITVFSPD